MGADVWLMRIEPDRPRLLEAGSISDLKRVRASPGVFPPVLVASSRPSLVLWFGSWAVPVPPEPAFSGLRPAWQQAQVFRPQGVSLQAPVSGPVVEAEVEVA
jgi:hypothetical protein